MEIQEGVCREGYAQVPVGCLGGRCREHGLVSVGVGTNPETGRPLWESRGSEDGGRPGTKPQQHLCQPLMGRPRPQSTARGVVRGGGYNTTEMRLCAILFFQVDWNSHL